ncbi:13616_t:CDS:2 [Ambispora leptoticha]|uniref:13616_t:CDS:1 n=1 Tax=Ambispora leptoticha TaxID=144679 RepID=A0A9N8ZV48_9GLOM|nr:13616_t:CDS:2 [Ambispora leptoticha]
MSEADAQNGSDSFSQGGHEERHRDRHITEDRHREEREDRHRDRHHDERHEDRHSDRRDDRRSPPSRSRSRSLRRASRSPRERRSSEEDDINPGNNLFVTGLSIRTEDRDLEEYFSKFGKVSKAQIMYDPHTRESRGFGFVTMETTDEADAAKEGLSGTEIHGRVVTVEKARRSKARTPTPGRYYGPPKRREPRRVDRFDPRYEYRSYDRYERPPRGYGRDPYYDRAYDRPYYDRGYDRGYERGYDRSYDRAYDRDRRPPPAARYDPYARPRSPY